MEGKRRSNKNSISVSGRYQPEGGRDRVECRHGGYKKPEVPTPEEFRYEFRRFFGNLGFKEDVFYGTEVGDSEGE